MGNAEGEQHSGPLHRYELTLSHVQRLASFYLLSMAISGFSQIICYGFAEIKPAGVLNTWRWIFFLFGVITIALGIAGLLLIVDFPDKAKFLNEMERKFIIDRVNADRGDGTSDVMTTKKAIRHLLDWKTWSFGLCFMSATLPVSPVEKASLFRD